MGAGSPRMRSIDPLASACPRRLVPQGAEGQAAAWRDGAEARQEIGHQHGDRVVQGRDAELAVGGARVEVAALLQGLPQGCERLRDRLREGERAGSRLHAVGAANEQRIAQNVAQPGQGVADRRLRQAELLGDRGQLAVPECAIQHHQKRQVQPAKLHIAYISHEAISISFI